jgi:hypothetical protein
MIVRVTAMLNVLSVLLLIASAMYILVSFEAVLSSVGRWMIAVTVASYSGVTLTQCRRCESGG